MEEGAGLCEKLRGGYEGNLGGKNKVDWIREMEYKGRKGTGVKKNDENMKRDRMNT